MKTNLAILSLLTILMLMAPSLVGAVSEEDFKVKTTRNLLNLCTAPADDPLREEAIHFCHGYLVGAYAYYNAEYSGPDRNPLVCFPDPPPSRNETIGMFIEWAKAHPEYMNEAPVETQFRFLMEKWPCKK
ncbi:Rap1a/Tai family immunity protein [Desulforhabdus amnigena]|uniref:Rap1a immunity protein domain-containing protein n=1 Tax=Desulforhabdus amnigena TaxID=40218 RepID=A0A9W6D0U3_9BACT|nr:Rap1a/Tai family immunity protein [Desulforhabdus amnigena]NLJ27258.1 hypothetical protein [Deltaproteobacteria bacterium]GLI32904.1 hypothetical protein DAMNIGENAA_03370 [Desulforhabdus amnigena]